MEGLAEVLAKLTPDEAVRVDELRSALREVWMPDAGNKPQQLAYVSEADITGFGGAAGGGKSDLLIGLALTRHKRVLMVRREKAQTEGLVQRIAKILGNTDGYASHHSRWQVPVGSQALIEFGGLDNPGDESRWQGRPHDLIDLDEVTEMREGQARFLMGWNRTDEVGQRCRVLMSFNPPTTVEGRWVIAFFAPWLDKKHPNPAKPGELRWFTTIDGKDREVPDARPFVLVNNEPVYEFDRSKFKLEDIITPRSRTFIPSRVTDNRYYADTGYIAQLQSMPEPLRSQMLYGDFTAGTEDDPMQVIPTAWVEAAMARWKPRNPMPDMDSVGVDVAMGGRDNTIIARRHEHWFDVPIVYEGHRCTNGPTVAGFVLAAQRDRAPIHIDLFGVGAEPYGHLMKMQAPVLGISMNEKTGEHAVEGRRRFFNIRSMLWWRMREALNPTNPLQIDLPNDRRLLADLCAPKWDERAGGIIYVEGRDEIILTLGRSPDFGTAYILALMHTPVLRETGMPQRHQPANPVLAYEATWRGKR